MTWHPLRPDCTPEPHEHDTPDPWAWAIQDNDDEVAASVIEHEIELDRRLAEGGF